MYVPPSASDQPVHSIGAGYGVLFSGFETHKRMPPVVENAAVDKL